MRIASLLWWILLEAPKLILAVLFWLFGTLIVSLEPDEMPGWAACTWLAIGGLVGGVALGVTIRWP